jgi:cyclase
MLSRRIIACLDVRDGRVVKGVRFAGHRDMGDVVALARRHRDAGADELVFYDIATSPRGTCADPAWVARVARVIDIPFCVAGGIRSVDQARGLLNAGADKISVNTPALERPALVRELADAFGSQCVVVGVDSRRDADGTWRVRSHAGDPARMQALPRRTLDWIEEAQALGAGEIVLNCMDSDGTRAGFDLVQLAAARAVCTRPLVASGGAGCAAHFAAAFLDADADAALAAGALHDGSLGIGVIKQALSAAGVPVRAS